LIMKDRQRKDNHNMSEFSLKFCFHNVNDWFIFFQKSWKKEKI
jgi:hypothetical protein